MSRRPLSDTAGVVSVASYLTRVSLGALRARVEAVRGGDGDVDRKGLCTDVGQLYGSPQAVESYVLFHPIEIDDQLFDGTKESYMKLRAIGNLLCCHSQGQKLR